MSGFKDVAEELARDGWAHAAKIYENFENGVGTYLKSRLASVVPHRLGH